MGELLRADPAISSISALNHAHFAGFPRMWRSTWRRPTRGSKSTKWRELLAQIRPCVGLGVGLQRSATLSGCGRGHI